MSVESGLSIVGFGAAALDVYRPIGKVGDDFVGGTKIGWSTQEDEALPGLLATAERHVGGNDMNALAYLATEADINARTSLVSVLGLGDIASESIRTHMAFMGIEDRTITHFGYLPSISIIERDTKDRMVRGRPRHPIGPHLSDAYIASEASEADVIVASSLKDPGLAIRIFRTLPADTFLSYNPGSAEFRDDPDAIIAAMQVRNPNLLAMNDDELRQLTRASQAANLKKLAEDATELAETVLYTGGSEFVALARRLRDGRVEHTYHPVEPLSGELIKDTLGAGDRAHAVAIRDSIAGLTGSVTLRNVAESTRRLIQHTGAHGDLYLSEDFVRAQAGNAQRPLVVASR